MTTISLLEISFFVFWLWTLMDLINQEGMKEIRKARLVIFHTFLGLIGIAFYFFLLISAFASKEVFGLTGNVTVINGPAFWLITERLRPSLIIAFVIILTFPFVAALNFILKGNLRAKRKLFVINIIETLSIFVSFVYILVIASYIEKINKTKPFIHSVKEVAHSKASVFGLDFGITTLSFTFNFVLYLFVITIIIWFISALYYVFLLKIPITRRKVVILNTDEIRKLTSMAKIYKNALYFLIPFAFILMRNAWNWMTGFRIKKFFISVGDGLINGGSGITEPALKKGGAVINFWTGIFEWISGKIHILKVWIGSLIFGIGDSFFTGHPGDVFSAGFVIAEILIFFALIVWLLLRYINSDLDAMQETHEVKMGGLKHSLYMNFFDAWKVSLFAALTTILLLVYFYKDPYFEVLKFVRSGIVITFEVTVAAMILSLILGLLAGLGKLSNNAFIKGIASVYIEVIRGVPLLVQLFYIHFGLGRFLNLPPLGSAISAMAICYGAYMGEIFRAGIQSISHGQVEAAKSLGMTNYQTMSKVILPQGFKVILPPIGNEFIALLKDSSLVSIIAVADILRRAREYVAIYFIPFEAYTLVALVYLVITLVLSKVVWNMEKIMATDK